MCREIRHIVVVMSTADVFGALANPVRRRVREILANGLQSAVAMSAHAEHLKVLRDAGLVYDEVAGRHRNYRLRGLADSLMSAADRAGPLSTGRAMPRLSCGRASRTVTAQTR